jgi:hypothetical protein
LPFILCSLLALNGFNHESARFSSYFYSVK